MSQERLMSANSGRKVAGWMCERHALHRRGGCLCAAQEGVIRSLMC